MLGGKSIIALLLTFLVNQIFCEDDFFELFHRDNPCVASCDEAPLTSVGVNFFLPFSRVEICTQAFDAFSSIAFKGPYSNFLGTMNFGIMVPYHSFRLVVLVSIISIILARNMKCASGIWGILAIGLFADNPYPLDTTSGRTGLFKGGGWELLGIQTLTAVCLALWSFLSSMTLLWFVNKLIPIRMDPHDELLGADLTEHRIRHTKVGVSRAMSALRPFSRESVLERVTAVGINPGHESYITKYKRKKKIQNIARMMSRKAKKDFSISNKIEESEAVSKKQDENYPTLAWLD